MYYVHNKINRMFCCFTKQLKKFTSTSFTVCYDLTMKIIMNLKNARRVLARICVLWNGVKTDINN